MCVRPQTCVRACEAALAHSGPLANSSHQGHRELGQKGSGTLGRVGRQFWLANLTCVCRRRQYVIVLEWCIMVARLQVVVAAPAYRQLTWQLAEPQRQCPIAVCGGQSGKSAGPARQLVACCPQLSGRVENCRQLSVSESAKVQSETLKH